MNCAPNRQETIMQMIKEQIIDPMILILIGAAALSAVLREWTEAAVIFTIVIVNAVIGIAQEKKAQSSLEALKKMSAPTARVMRQGEESVIPAAEIVPGDVVFLSDGDMVPADMRLIESANLKIQEASLTGESVPAEKDADEILPQECSLGDRVNMAYSSTIVTYGTRCRSSDRHRNGHSGWQHRPDDGWGGRTGYAAEEKNWRQLERP